MMNVNPKTAPSLELVSIHFAKAGGTSLAHILKQHYGDGLEFDFQNDPCRSDGSVCGPLELARTVTAVHGHMRPDVYPVDSTTKLITFLREPVDKLLSVYFFWLTLKPCGSPDHDKFLADRPSVFEYAEETAGVAFSAYFGGFNMSRFNFIGFHDRRKHDLKTLSTLLGFPCPSEVALNTTPYSPERVAISTDPKKMSRLAAILRNDISFYSDIRSDWSNRERYYNPHN
jgi:hypothetical protein